MPDFQILIGDALEQLRTLPEASVDCVVTSPPYWGLRDYGHAGQIGLEETPEAFVAALVEVFREVWRVLKPEGTLWLNLGDSYAASTTSAHGRGKVGGPPNPARMKPSSGLKVKDLVGIPWMVAFALRADGWYLRQDIIWAKPNPMPESVTDRCTKSHEYVFMLSRGPRYFYDSAAIRNPPSPELIKQVEEGYAGQALKPFNESGVQDASATKSRIIEGMRKRIDKQRGHTRRHAGFNGRWDKMTHAEQTSLGSNKRSVWTISPQPFRGAHFAVMPEAVVEPCILAGCPEGGLVLDPFTGSGTVGVVALKTFRRFVGIEINPTYAAMATRRIQAAVPGPSLFLNAQATA